jgi:hypothetical protein
MKKIKKFNERIDWKGQWIPDEESPFDKISEYSLKQDLKAELLFVIKKYEGRIKNKTIIDVAKFIIKKYEI